MEDAVGAVEGEALVERADGTPYGDELNEERDGE
jgi:hypothetical protein